MSTAAVEREAIQDALPARLWQENSHGLVSLLVMLRFHASHFVAIANTLGQASMDMRAGRSPSQRTISIIVAQVSLLTKHCEDLELPLTLAHLKRFRNDVLTDQDVGVDRVFRALDEIQQRLWDELDSRVVFAIQPSAASYFEHSQFAASVYERFPQSIFDAEEAGKCRALERPTACVFHLMRVTEHGLQEIAKRIGIKDPRPNWEPIICKIDSELKKGYKDRQYKGMSDFLANVSAHLNAVKVAWRNRVMHVDTKHTMEEAREIYSATAGLMRYIAENLPNDAGMVALVRGIINR